MIGRPNPWFPRQVSRPLAKVRLFCFPFAGGGAGAFRPWAERLSAQIELLPVQPPGRENRWSEEAYEDVHLLADQIAQVILPYLDRPFALFGHSLGGLTAFEVARRLQERSALHPSHLFVSACGAPNGGLTKIYDDGMTDEEVIQLLRSRSGSRLAIFSDEDLKGLLPRYRQDLRARESYRYRQGPALRFPITVLGGTEDPNPTPSQLDGWKELSAHFAGVRLFPGGHFFAWSDQADVLGLIEETLLTHSSS